MAGRCSAPLVDPPVAPTTTAESADLENFEIDQSLLAVLTEYEEHRLLVSVKQGLDLFLVRVQFELATLDKALTEIKDRAKPFGEVITYLPAGEAASPDLIELDLLLASGAELSAIQAALANERISVRQIPRQKKAATRSAKAPPRTNLPRGVTRHGTSPAKDRTTGRPAATTSSAVPPRGSRSRLRRGRGCRAPRAGSAPPRRRSR